MNSDSVYVGTQLTHFFEERLSTYLQELAQLCAIECPTSSKQGVDQAADWVQHWATQRGWEVQRFPDAHVGDALCVTIRHTGQRNVLMAAHLDTVYPIGTAAERPMRIEGDMILGPGTADNKSGLLSTLYAMDALESLGMLEGFASLTLMCGGDEETDMRASIQLIQSLVPHYEYALVLEAARENGDIVGARKGGGAFTLEAHGRAAHAGVEPEKGAHAILALAQQIVDLQALNALRPGVTVNVGLIRGGSVINAVPDYARADIDVRVIQPDDVELVTQAIQAIAGREYVPGVSTSITGGFHVGPMAYTPAIAGLAQLAQECAQALGFSVKIASTGGISYANHFAMLGVPVLDGLGPLGGLDHSPREYISMASIVPRTALLALLIRRLV